jgi:class 3 adenylate cyclase
VSILSLKKPETAGKQAGRPPLDLELTREQRQAVEEFREQHHTGVLALLFSDVEGSTAMRLEMGDIPASNLLRRHNSVLRDLLAQFADAQEISSAGDSLFIVFTTPSSAVRFGLMAQARLRALAEELRPAFRVRMGIHLGEVVVEQMENGGTPRDVLGMQVHLAARVTALAAGGQILMTRGVFDNARQILKGQSLPGVNDPVWVTHGYWLLKGFDEPVAICEMGEAGWAPLREPVNCEAGQRVNLQGESWVPSNAPAGSARKKIRTYLLPSVMVTILLCWPLGLPAIFFGLLTQKHLAGGNLEEARSASRRARRWFRGAVLVGLIAVFMHWRLGVLQYLMFAA